MNNIFYIYNIYEDEFKYNNYEEKKHKHSSQPK